MFSSTKTWLGLLGAFVGIGITCSSTAYAQQTTGTPGSPGATTTIDGKQLPPPDPNFGGVIKDDALQSKPWWAPRVIPPKGAPNVLLIITDDAGFGAIGRILLDNGYATSWFGKDHNTPVYTASQVGPFDQWPTGMGFEYFYGFVGGDANQWAQVEIFAAYAAYSDHEIGRVIQAFEDLGKLDNTLIIYINGDNGTSAEGGPLGTPNEVAFFNGLNQLPVDVQMKFYDVWGTEQTYNHMSAGWSWAFDTPFDWFKQNASRLGGINQNIVSWPARIKDKGALREQFMHVIDVVPTILEAAGSYTRDGRWHQAGADRRHELRLHF
jgi:arylsulfatase A-like enzyme